MSGPVSKGFTVFVFPPSSPLDSPPLGILGASIQVYLALSCLIFLKENIYIIVNFRLLKFCWSAHLNLFPNSTRPIPHLTLVPCGEVTGGVPVWEEISLFLL